MALTYLYCNFFSPPTLTTLHCRRCWVIVRLRSCWPSWLPAPGRMWRERPQSTSWECLEAGRRGGWPLTSDGEGWGLCLSELSVSSRDGCRFLRSKPELIAAVFALTSDPSVAIVKDCYHIVINLSADETLHQVSSWFCFDWLTTVFHKVSETVGTERLFFLFFKEVPGFVWVFLFYYQNGFRVARSTSWTSWD